MEDGMSGVTNREEKMTIADSKGVRSRTTSLPENSYVKVLARLGICQLTHLGVLH